MERLQHNRQEVNNQKSAEVSELVTDPERLAELIAEAKEVKERMEEIPEEINGQLVVCGRDDCEAIEVEAKKLTELLASIPDAVKREHGLPSDYHSPEAVNDPHAPRAVAA